MEIRQKMSGFLDIKSEFLDKFPELKCDLQLSLSFIGVGDLLVVRSSMHVEMSMVIAILNYSPKEKIKFNLNPKSRGRDLILFFFDQFDKNTAMGLAKKMNEHYKLCGTNPPSI